MPLKNFSGSLKKDSLSSTLMPFFDHIKSIYGFDTDLINKAIDENWVFESTIPIGYGVGSDNSALQDILAQMESYFHGNSSGLDPLTSYLNACVLSKEASLKTYPDFIPNIPLFLFDSGIKRSTKPLVNYYLKKKKDDLAFQGVIQRLDVLNSHLIYDYLENNKEKFRENLKLLSRLQLTYFQKMIPDNIHSFWSKGLENDSYYMKLSGAGGGGFFLVYGNTETLDQQSLIKL